MTLDAAPAIAQKEPLFLQKTGPIGLETQENFIETMAAGSHTVQGS